MDQDTFRKVCDDLIVVAIWFACLVFLTAFWGVLLWFCRVPHVYIFGWCACGDVVFVAFITRANKQRTKRLKEGIYQLIWPRE